MNEKSYLENATEELISALNKYMGANEICETPKAIVRVNSFKKWVLNFRRKN